MPDEKWVLQNDQGLYYAGGREFNVKAKKYLPKFNNEGIAYTSYSKATMQKLNVSIEYKIDLKIVKL